MLSSIRKFSKSILAKIFIALIALPFLLWGMGDVFTSGKQNVLVEINDEKVNTKDFITYLQKINLSPGEIESLGKSKLFEDILTNYISEKIIDMETKKRKLSVSDSSLMKILMDDKNFQKEGKFSRTKYEKFLLKNRYTAPTYERYLRSIELKGQLLNYYSGGIKVPKFVVNELFQKENKKVEIEFLDLNKIYSKNIIKEEEIEKFYKKNKNLFNERFISFRYLKLLPENLTKKNNFDEEYYEKLDDLENQILDGKKFDLITSNNKKFVKKITFVNSRKTKEDGTVVKEINDKLFNKIFLIKEKNSPQFIEFENNYFIAELLEEKNINLTLKDRDLKKTIEAQLKITFKVNENKKIFEKINNKKFDKNDMFELSKKNNVEIKKVTVNKITDTKEFGSALIKKIYGHNSGEIFLLSDTILKENFLARIVKEINPDIKTNSEDYKKYIRKANAEYIRKIYKSYDKYINANYKVDLNNRVLERLKNSF